MKEARLVDSISHKHIRNILLKHSIRWRPSKMILDESRDHQYDIKKVHWTIEIQYIFWFRTVVSRWERTDSGKNIRCSFMIAVTIKYWKSAENKRLAQCVWCVRPYKWIPSKDKSSIFTYQIFRIKSDWSRCMWMQRQAVNNSTFENEQDIGKAVTEWIRSYNKKHDKAITNILQEVTIDVFT